MHNAPARGRLPDAAMEMMSRRFNGRGVQDIVGGAGALKGWPCNHLRGKEALRSTAVERYRGQRAAPLPGILSDAAIPPGERIVRHAAALDDLLAAVHLVLAP